MTARLISADLSADMDWSLPIEAVDRMGGDIVAASIDRTFAFTDNMPIKLGRNAWRVAAIPVSAEPQSGRVRQATIREVSMAELVADMRGHLKTTISVRLVMPKAMGLRLWLVGKILRLAGLISPVGIEVVTLEEIDEVKPRWRSWQVIGGKTVPRQLSVRPRSPLYVEDWWSFSQDIDVYLDGVRQDHVIAYDCDEGFVRKDRIVNGKPVIRDDEIETIIVRGNVELRACD